LEELTRDAAIAYVALQAEIISFPQEGMSNGKSLVLAVFLLSKINLPKMIICGRI